MRIGEIVTVVVFVFFMCISYGANATVIGQSEGLSFIKAANNARSGTTMDFRQLQNFFSPTQGNDNQILSRTEALLAELDDDDSIKRISVIATLMLESGKVYEANITNGYQLSVDSTGWDFGPNGSPVHKDFRKVTEHDVVSSGYAVSDNDLVDGLSGVRNFSDRAINGVYTVTVVFTGRDTKFDTFEINGSNVIVRNVSEISNRLDMTKPGDEKLHKSIAIRTWTVVTENQLNVAFPKFPENSVLSAIIITPVNMLQVIDRRVEDLIDSRKPFVYNAGGFGSRNGFDYGISRYFAYSKDGFISTRGHGGCCSIPGDDGPYDVPVFVPGGDGDPTDVPGITIPGTVPEPGALALFGIGIIGLLITRRRKK